MEYCSGGELLQYLEGVKNIYFYYTKPKVNWMKTKRDSFLNNYLMLSITVISRM